MAEIILVVGGTRSGKSDYALTRAESIDGRRCFIATCTALDREMQERIARHRAARDPQRWTTVEEPLQLGQAITAHVGHDVYLIDCLTLWISNFLHELSDLVEDGAEAYFDQLTGDLLDTLSAINGTVLLVSGEVGMGIVPENRLARLYRDLVGRCNRVVADRADEVILVSCGLPLSLKGKKGVS